MGLARIGECRCQVALVMSEYRLCKLCAGVYREKYIPGCVGSSRAELGHEQSALYGSWYTTGSFKREGGRG